MKMIKKEYFKLAMTAGLYKDLAWLISLFALIKEDENDWKQNPFAFRLVRHVHGYFFVDENKTLIPIEDSDYTKPFMEPTDLVNLQKGDLPNLNEDIESTYGNWIINYLLLIYPFGTKIPYIDGDITPSTIERIISKNFKDNPKNFSDRKPDEFYVDEYLKYLDGINFLPGLTQICVWACTEKLLLPAPGIKEFKNKLLEEHKDSLDQLSTVAKIDAELVKYDKEWLKGDPGMNFLNSSKSINVIRKQKFGMRGSEIGLNNDTVKGSLMKNSLLEGWDINQFDVINDTVRAGSYNRGAETQLGGVGTKDLLRASSTLNVTVDDCGTVIGKEIFVTNDNKQRLIGFKIFEKEGQVKIENEQMANSYINKRVYVRSPQFCKLTTTDYCKECLGDNLSLNPNGLPLAISSYGSIMMSMMMGAMHSKELVNAKMHFNKVIF